MVKKLSSYLDTLKSNKLAQDSFWAVFGNGVGNLFLLLAGILVARFLGKDLYGEYGLVKTTMFYMASFATFGLGITSTKYVATVVQEDNKKVGAVIFGSLSISAVFSFLMAVALLIFAEPLARYSGKESLAVAYRALGIIVFFRSLSVTITAILSGFKQFKINAINSMIAGLFMICICVPLAYFLSLKGALCALLFSQIFNFLLNLVTLRRYLKKEEICIKKQSDTIKELICFSFPIAIQESSYTICTLCGVTFLTKLSSAGELGLYTASSQWHAVVLMIPGLLTNVVLSYLSSSLKSSDQHQKTLKLMLTINLICAFVPLVFVSLLAKWIASFYGPTFSGMPMVIRILLLAALFESCASVLKSEFVSQGLNWGICIIRTIRDVTFLVVAYVLLKNHSGENGAVLYSSAYTLSSILFVITMFSVLYLKNKRKSCN